MKPIIRLLFIASLFSSFSAHAQCVESTEMLEHMNERYIELIDKSGGSVLLRVKVADEPAEMAAGFQHICAHGYENLAILFVFEQVKKPTFHMNNVHANLDIAFIDESGLIGDIQLMREEFSTGIRQYYPTDIFAKYALEVPEGYYEKHQIEAGKSLLNING